MIDEQVPVKRDHLFKPGQSGNPKGRPPNSRNAISLVKVQVESELREQMKPQMEAIVAKMIEQALDGDREMQKTLFNAWVGKNRAQEDEKPREPININIGKLDQIPPVNGVVYSQSKSQEQ